MKRKLVQQGSSTMMVSLPSKWIKTNQLGKGKEIELEEERNKLVISTDSLQKKGVELSLVSNSESYIRTILTNMYRKGYEKIKINFKDKSSLKIIEDITERQLIGFEVIKKSEKHCEIENITEPSKEQFENIFSKMTMNIEELFLTTEAFFQGEKREFEETEDKIKEFDNFCRRITEKEGTENKELLLFFHSELMHGQRDIYHLLKFLQKNKSKVGKEELELLKKSKLMFSLLLEAYKNKKLETIEKIHELETESYKKGYLLLEDKKSNPVVIHHLLNSIREFYLASSPLTGLAL